MTRIAALIVAALMAALPTVDRTPEPACHSASEDGVLTDCDYRGGAWYPDGSDDAACHSAAEDSVMTDCDYRAGAWYPNR